MVVSAFPDRFRRCVSGIFFTLLKIRAAADGQSKKRALNFAFSCSSHTHCAHARPQFARVGAKAPPWPTTARSARPSLPPHRWAGGCSARLARTVTAAAAAALSRSLSLSPSTLVANPIRFISASPSSPARRNPRNRPKPARLLYLAAIVSASLGSHATHTQARRSTQRTRNIRPRLHLGAFRIRCPFHSSSIDTPRRSIRHCLSDDNAVWPGSGNHLIPDPPPFEATRCPCFRRYSQPSSQSASPLSTPFAVLQTCRALRTTPCSDNTFHKMAATSCIHHTSKRRILTISDTHCSSQCSSSSSRRSNRTHICRRLRLSRAITTLSRSNRLLSTQPPPPCSPDSPPLLPHPPPSTRLQWRNPPWLLHPTSRSR